MNIYFSPLEIDQNITRQHYFFEGLGRIYNNRFGIAFFTNLYPKINKLESMFFSVLGKPIFYILIFAILIYFGYRKYAKKK